MPVRPPVIIPVPKARINNTSVLYGVGVAQAILNEKAQALKQFGKEELYGIQLSTLSQEYNPDAYPTPNGYLKSSQWDGKMSSSLSGMPVMCYLKFIGGDYIDLAGNSVTIPDIIFETVVITATMNPNIVSENIAGKQTGSVKEYIGLDDWDVEVRAIITSDAPVNESVERVNQTGGVYPRDNMSEIYKLLSCQLSIPIDCWYLNQFNIRYLVIQRGTTIEQIEGEYGTQRIIVPCLSDNPLIIRRSR